MNSARPLSALPARVLAVVAPTPAVWLLPLLALLAYGLLAIMQWRQYHSASYDLAIFTQLLDRYAHGAAPIVNVKGAGYNLLGDHFHPLLAVLTPVYALAPSALTVLLLQVVLLAASVYFVTRMAWEQLGVAAGWLIGGGYALSWGVQNAAAAQFHEVSLGAMVASIALWALVRKSWLAAAGWAGLLVFVKEDLGMTVVVFAAVLAWRSRRWLLSGLLAVWGAAWLVVTVKIIIPALNPDAGYDFAQYLSPAQVLAQPGATILEILGNDAKMATLGLLLLCTAGLLLRSEIGLLVLPTLAWRFLSVKESYWGPTWHYSVILMPIAFAAVIDATARMRRSRWVGPRAFARHAAVIVATVAAVLTINLPLFELRNPRNWATGPRQLAAARVVDAVPVGASVAGDLSLLNYLVPDRDVYFIGQKGNPVVDYLVADTRSGGWSAPVRLLSYAPSIYPGTRWELVIDEEGYQLAQRVG